MSKITSGYDFVYSELSDADREKLAQDIEKLLSANIASVQGRLATEVEKAVTSLYNNLICNPWGDVIKENSGSCEFINAITEHVWKMMLDEDPAKVSKYELSTLIDAWRTKHPDQFKEIVGNDVAEKLTKLQDRLDFEIKCARRNF